MLPSYVATGIIPYVFNFSNFCLCALLRKRVSDSSTVNGVARFNGGPEVPWPVINVKAGRRYRLRVINQSARNVVTFNVDNHTLTVGTFILRM